MKAHTGWVVANKNGEPVGLTVRGWEFFPHFFFAEEEDAKKFLDYLKTMPFYSDDELSVCKTTLAISC